MFAVQRHHRFCLLLGVVVVVFLDLLQLRLKPLHHHLVLGAFLEYREQEEAYQGGEKNYCEPEVAERNGVIKEDHGVQKRLIEDDVIKVLHCGLRGPCRRVCAPFLKKPSEERVGLFF